MEKYNVVNELYKLLVEQLRKSGMAVTLLCLGIWAQWNLNADDKKDLKESLQLYKLETGLEIKALRTQIEVCNEHRIEAYREIASLRAQIELLTAERRHNK